MAAVKFFSSSSTKTLKAHASRLRDITKVLIEDTERCDIFKHASAMAYVSLLSLIPSLAAVFTLVSLFLPIFGGQGELLLQVRSFILSNLAAGSGDKVLEYLDSFLANLDIAKIGATGFAGVTVSLVLLLRQVENALNRIWQVQVARNMFTRFIYFSAFLMLSTLFAGIAIGVLSGGSLAALNPFAADAAPRSFLARITPHLAVLAGFIALYKVVPNRFVAFRHAIVGAIPAAFFLTQASRFYGHFTASFTNYQAVYGALAAVPVFLLWLYVMWVIILLGAVFAWRAEQGFSFEKSISELQETWTPSERYRANLIQSWMPIICLTAIFQRFMKGDGMGVQGHELSARLHLAAPWVADALEFLRERRHVVAVLGSNDGLGEHTLDRTYFPAFPPESVSLDGLTKSLEQGFQEWATQWQPDWDPSLRDVITMFTVPNQRSAMTMAELLAKLESAQL